MTVLLQLDFETENMISSPLSLNSCRLFYTYSKTDVKRQPTQDTQSPKKSQLEGSSAESQRTHKQLTQHHRASNYCEDQAINQLVRCSLNRGIHFVIFEYPLFPLLRCKIPPHANDSE